MSTDLRESATVQALVSVLVRHLQKKRAALLGRVDTCGPITEVQRQDSHNLDQLDDILRVSLAEERLRIVRTRIREIDAQLVGCKNWEEVPPPLQERLKALYDMEGLAVHILEEEEGPI